MLAKKRLHQGIERFRRQFGDQPTQALGSVLPAADLQKLVVEEVGTFRECIYLLAYNLVCALMVRAAVGSGVAARALSFKGTIQLFLAFEQQLRFAGRGSIGTMTAHLLGGISLLRLPVRPGRVEPHAIKRRPKPHMLLTVPRDVARSAILMSRGISA